MLSKRQLELIGLAEKKNRDAELLLFNKINSLEDELTAKIDGLKLDLINLESLVHEIELTPGPQGEQGIQGEKGESGQAGKNGLDGKPGKDAAGILSLIVEAGACK